MFNTGDKVIITSKALLAFGKTGVIERFLHSSPSNLATGKPERSAFIVRFDDNGHTALVLNHEMSPLQSRLNGVE
jgi:hypothetical protein